MNFHPIRTYREILKEIKEDEYKPVTLDEINSKRDRTRVLNNDRRLTSEELNIYLKKYEAEHGEKFIIPDGAFINKDYEIEYEDVERIIKPPTIICPDCGGFTYEGLEFCVKCGGEIHPI